MAMSRRRLSWIAASVAAAAALAFVALDGDEPATAQAPADSAELRERLSAQARVRIPRDAKLISADEDGGMFGYAKRYWFEYAPRPARVTDALLCDDLGLPRLEKVDPANFGDAELTQHFGAGSGDSMVCGVSDVDASRGGGDRSVRAGRRYLFIFLGSND